MHYLSSFCQVHAKVGGVEVREEGEKRKKERKKVTQKSRSRIIGGFRKLYHIHFAISQANFWSFRFVLKRLNEFIYLNSRV